MPTVVNIKTRGGKDFSLWDLFSKTIDTVKSERTFCDVKLMMPAERGRVTRSGSSYTLDRHGFEILLKDRYKNWDVYLQRLIEELEYRFEPWPVWLFNTEKAFNFDSSETNETKISALNILLDLPVYPHKLVQEEKDRIRAEFLSFLINGEKVKESSTKKLTQTELWYILLTEEHYYKQCYFFNAFALQLINRSANEGIVEVEVKSIKEISSEKRPLQNKTSEQLNFISTNGPHPLVASELVRDSLNAYFGKDWHFILSASSYYTSKVVDRHFKDARSLPNSLI